MRPSRSRVGRSLARLLAVSLIASSCATVARPIATVPATDQKPVHDAIAFPNGSLELYPDHVGTRMAIFNEESAEAGPGAVITATCMNADCSAMTFEVNGGASKTIALPQGGYQLLQTSDPRLVQVNDITGREQLGYLAKNNGEDGAKFFPNLASDGGYKFFPDAQGAEAYEHKGDAARLAGKIVLYTLVGILLVGLIAVAVYADAQANTTTTTCTSNANSTTCKSRTGF